MSIPQVLALAALRLLSGGNETLKWKTVQQWINENGNPRNIGKGYASFNPNMGKTGNNCFVELRKEPKGKTCTVTAAVYFDRRQGAAASRTWDSVKLDSELEKMFGRNLKTRISI